MGKVGAFGADDVKPQVRMLTIDSPEDASVGCRVAGARGETREHRGMEGLW
jgi:hypothetical protein